MKNDTKILSICALTCAALGGLVSAAFASDPVSLSSKMSIVGGAAGFGERTLGQTIGGVISGILMLLGVIFMAYTIYAGYIWLTSAGNEEKLTKAKAILRGSIIGLIIVLGAYAITAFVISQVIKSTGYDQGTTTPAPTPAP